MRAEKPELIIHINLPENFINIVKDVMEDEIEVASKKWGVRLNTDDRRNIIRHSINQLQYKVSDNSRTAWDLGDTINVRVNIIGQKREITLPNPKIKEKSTTKLAKNKDGWKIEEEDVRDDLVPLAEFDEYFKNLIYTWARTAVFYGVGSYA